jgi:hypothetical protein
MGYHPKRGSCAWADDGVASFYGTLAGVTVINEAADVGAEVVSDEAIQSSHYARDL